MSKVTPVSKSDSNNSANEMFYYINTEPTFLETKIKIDKYNNNKWLNKIISYYDNKQKEIEQYKRDKENFLIEFNKKTKKEQREIREEWMQFTTEFNKRFDTHYHYEYFMFQDALGRLDPNDPVLRGGPNPYFNSNLPPIFPEGISGPSGTSRTSGPSRTSRTPGPSRTSRTSGPSRTSITSGPSRTSRIVTSFAARYNGDIVPVSRKLGGFSKKL